MILCYFLIVSGMFFSDSLLATLYIFCTVLFNTAILIHIQFPRLLLVPALKCSAFMALRAFPLMLLLFLLFPRVQGGMWGRPATMEAKTGFSSEIAFGSIAQLAQSGKVAFRVTFADGRIPAKEQLYWRGIVFMESFKEAADQIDVLEHISNRPSAEGFLLVQAAESAAIPGTTPSHTHQ